MERLRVALEGVFTARMSDFLEAGGAAVFCPDAAGYIRWSSDIQKGGDLEILLNSEGGDTSGAEMIANAIRYAAGNGWKCSVIVEGLAASAAANMLLRVKDVARIAMRQGSQLMFHSCAAAVFGGAEAMRDAAEGIDGYNDGIKALLGKYTDLPKERYEEWFAEGRMGWLTAQEAQSCGLADEILGEVAAPLANMDDGAATMVAMWRRGIRVALLNRACQKSEVTMADEKEDLKEEVKEEIKEEIIDKGAEEEKKPEDIPVDEIVEKLKVLEEQNKDILARLAECEKQRDAAEAKVAKLTSGIKAQGTAPSGKKWPELVREACEGKIGRSMDEAYLALKVQYPGEYQAYIKGKRSYHNN